MKTTLLIFVFVCALRLDDLRDDLARRQVALEALQPARAELAAVGATHLRRDAQREAIAPLAEHVERRRNQHALDVIAGTQMPEQLPCGVMRALHLLQLQRAEIVGRLELLPQRRGQIRHLRDRRHALRINPFCYLLAAIRPPVVEVPFLGRLVEQKRVARISRLQHTISRGFAKPDQETTFLSPNGSGYFTHPFSPASEPVASSSPMN